MNNIEKKEKKDYMEKLTDYVLIFFFIAFIIFFVFYMEHHKMQYYQNHNNTLISANAQSINEVSNFDNVLDLTGTSWVINSTTCTAGYGQFNVNIIILDENGDIPSYGSECNYIYIGYLWGNRFSLNPTSNSVIVNEPGYLYDDYFVTFISGNDVTNTNLISWLQSNATQIQTGYSSTINLTNCTCNKSSETGLTGSYTATITANTGYVLTNVTTTLGTITYSNNNKVATISISDVTDDFTISAIASLIYHNISYNLGNVVVISNKPTQIDEISTINITFQPFSNYVLPEYINVEGVTEYIWNDDTGVLTLVNAFDNVEITINAEYKSGQYTFVELIDSVTLVPVNTFFNLFNFELLGVNIYNLLLSALILFVIIKIILKVFK